MRILICSLAAIFIAAPATAQVYVHGYTRSNGTYVAPYTRTAPDHSIYNNYSTSPNINPYTGQRGTVNPYGSRSTYSAPAPSYGYTPAPSSYGATEEAPADPQ